MSTLENILSKYREGWSLDRDFYLNPEVFAAEKIAIWKKHWLFAGFTCEIPNAGDYISYSLIDQPIIIIRGDEGEVYAHHNTCRHRGSVICTGESGNEPNLVCPYHNCDKEAKNLAAFVKPIRTNDAKVAKSNQALISFSKVMYI
jgi:phenylpropionate dioxygenase-like ring-hydroxylating dioxygenase large terminal subunit